MCDIPLDLERRFERRWAARFSGPAKEHRLEAQQQHQRVATPDKSKRKTRRCEPAVIKPACKIAPDEASDASRAGSPYPWPSPSRLRRSFLLHAISLKAYHNTMGKNELPWVISYLMALTGLFWLGRMLGAHVVLLVHSA
jgi:hypothetical protein